MRYYVYALLIIAVDQLTKWIVKSRLTLGEARSVIGDFFLITSHRNKGAAFSILQGQRWFFILITLVVVGGVIWYLQRMRSERRTLMCTALSLLLGGAVGNLIDRAFTGEVVDFLQFNFHFFWFGKEVYYTYPIFNVADSAIVVGVALIFLEALVRLEKGQTAG
ncbi:signal peptidase II [Gordoniibacillus kamchatkensis]|uniref:Lipoprotein signal peptidase n=1 Tax=Gordoniibacillus kamchatkensis TaxID=1590651 RepID=A0ABR5ALC8_9BACL|nr:signal peptidase II [Paenibacillus sp. VKM B-2647]KIL41766.1 signal peptidase II [Paenibacillus sp. VKM B-2647]